MRADRTTILLTGATGFVGRHLAPVLAARGGQVRGATRSIPARDREGVAEWVGLEDVGPATRWSEALRGVGTVIHLAALAHRTDPRRQPREEDYMAVNAAGTRQLAEAARNIGVRRFIFVSSIGAVAEASDLVVDEAVAPKPVSAYGRSKLAGEEAVREVLGGSLVEWCVLRPVLAYGPGNPGNMARLLRLVRSGLPLPLAGIRNRRSFVYIGNLVDAIDRVAVTPGISGRVFHVADDEAVSTPELIQFLAEAAGRKARLWPVPDWSLRLAARGGDLAGGLGLHTGLDTYSLRRLMQSLTVSNQALRKATRWRPRATLMEGLRATFRLGDADHP
ncbi:MAG: Nucleoside-diphosphate-sugar epimerase [Verrucomicrobia bacterium]|nr:MAG: Nucleoside-diphosphate-sugar epimerase [Verrucomicrobiota bacterium]